MKKTITFIAIAILAACSKPAIEDQKGYNAGDFTLSAELQPLTKTALDEESYLIWSRNDQISSWIANDESNANIALTLDPASAGQRTGNFSGSLNPSTENFTLYALYPYNSNYGSDPSNIVLNIPSTVSRSTDVNSVIGQSDFMMATATLNSSDEEHKIAFSHPLALLNIVIDGSGSIFRETKIASVEMKANTKFVGAANCDLISGSLILDETDPEAGKSLVINYDEAASMSSPQSAWVAVAPVDLSDAECKFVITMTNGQLLTINANPKKAFEAQTRYTLTFSDLDAWIEAGAASPNYFDLVAAGGRANCYIISEGGYYRFDARYPTNAKTLEITGTESADWLWATGNKSLVDGVFYNKNRASIFFKVEPQANGNTIIAAFDEAGKITWSWHIWMSTEDPLTPNHYTRNNAWLMADRNLGATSNNPGDIGSYGFYYQWGRKDPFPGAASVGSISNTGAVEDPAFTDATQEIVINPKYSGISFTSTRHTNAGADDIAFAIANPTTFLHPYATGSNGLAQTWLSTTAQVDAVNLWSTDRSKKSNYDPCPSGYCVPSANTYAWYSLWNATCVTAEPTATLGGVVFRENDNNTTYYPAAGYRRSGVLYSVGHTAYYWSATANISGTNFQERAMQCTNRTTITNNASARTEFALSVRCMKQ